MEELNKMKKDLKLKKAEYKNLQNNYRELFGKIKENVMAKKALRDEIKSMTLEVRKAKLMELTQ